MHNNMKLSTADKILIIGGHLTPALAVLEELEARGYYNFLWVGVKHSQTSARNLSAEYQLITSKNIPFISFKAGKLWRKWTVKTFFMAIYNLLLIPWGIVHALFILLQHRPKLVLSFGGYLAFPIVFAAWLLKIKSATHEQSLAMGLANQRIANYANKILLAWQENLEQLPKKLRKKAIVTGNPVRKSLLTVTTNQYNFNNTDKIIFVTGGNQGANTINKRLFTILPELLQETNVIHQVGNSSITRDLKKAKQVWEKLPKNLQKKYVYFDNNFTNEFSEIMHKADLIVSRSGANTVTDIMSLGKRAVLIPIPWSANDEQQKNALLVAGTGLGYILEQYDEMPASQIKQAIEYGLDIVNRGQDFKGRNFTIALKEAKEKVQPDAALNIVKVITA